MLQSWSCLRIIKEYNEAHFTPCVRICHMLIMIRWIVQTLPLPNNPSLKAKHTHTCWLYKYIPWGLSQKTDDFLFSKFLLFECGTQECKLITWPPLYVCAYHFWWYLDWWHLSDTFTADVNETLYMSRHKGASSAVCWSLGVSYGYCSWLYQDYKLAICQYASPSGTDNMKTNHHLVPTSVW